MEHLLVVNVTAVGIIHDARHFTDGLGAHFLAVAAHGTVPKRGRLVNLGLLRLKFYASIIVQLQIFDLGTGIAAVFGKIPAFSIDKDKSIFIA